MKAANNWLQLKVEPKGTGFQVADSTLLEGTVVSIGGKIMNEAAVPFIKVGQTVLFPSQHGKVMEHSIKGVKYYFVDKDIILAYE